MLLHAADLILSTEDFLERYSPMNLIDTRVMDRELRALWSPVGNSFIVLPD